MMASSGDNVFMEEIIKRRLQNDGDGTGDDRKLNSVGKTYTSLVEGDDSEENDAATLKRFIQQIKNQEYVVKRTIEAIKLNQETKQFYADLKVEVQSEIQGTQEHIEKSKRLLEEATKHRKYSMEYDALAKLIESKPDRKMTEIKRMGLALELDVLKKRQAKVAEQLDSRKRTVSMLSGAIEIVKDLVKTSDEKAPRRRKSPKKAKKRKHGTPPSTPSATNPGDIDSTSQSEPSSPMEQPPSQESANGGLEVAGSGSMAITTIPPSTSAPAVEADKAKSEKYEDLSESEGDANT